MENYFRILLFSSQMCCLRIAYSECVFVALGIVHAMRMRRIVEVVRLIKKERKKERIRMCT
jgi:hypothetical protein